MIHHLHAQHKLPHFGKNARLQIKKDFSVSPERQRIIFFIFHFSFWFLVFGFSPPSPGLSHQGRGNTFKYQPGPRGGSGLEGQLQLDKAGRQEYKLRHATNKLRYTDSGTGCGAAAGCGQSRKRGLNGWCLPRSYRGRVERPVRHGR